MLKKLPLGSSVPTGIGIVAEPQGVEERLKLLETKLSAMTEAFYVARNALIEKGKENNNAYENVDVEAETNKDGIPINSHFIGISKGVPNVLMVNKDGLYVAGNSTFNSLSAAAKKVSGVRRSGWVFWKLFDGRTVKEAFRK